MRKIFFDKKIKILYFSIILMGVISFSAHKLFAVWSGTYYNPGDTLNPECLPTDSECDVLVFPTQTGNSGKYLTTNGTTTSWATVSGGLSNVVEDTTPQLGGDLDLNGNVITGMVIGTNIQAYDADLTTYAGITPSSNVQTLLGSANYSSFRTSLGLAIGTDVQAYDADLTTYAGITPSSNVQTLLGSANYSSFRTSLGLAIGTDVQAYNSKLADFVSSNLALASNTFSASSGAITITPASGSNLNVSLATTGDFAVNTDDLYVDTSSGYVGIGTSSPAKLLSVNGDAVINTLNIGLGGSSVATNIGIGYETLPVNTTGNDNVATGYQSLKSNTTGDYNSAFGSRSLYLNTEGYDNVAIGYQSLYSNTTGYQNTAVGRYALNSNTTGYGNTALGRHALVLNTSGAYNTGVGHSALINNTSGIGNNAFGYESSESITSGRYNSSFGGESLEQNTTAYYNSAFGYRSLRYTTGANNTALGSEALYSNTSGVNNVAIGFSAGDNNGSSDVFNNNIFIGYQAANNITTGADNNIVIGYDIDLPTAGGDNQLNIGNIIFGTGLTGTGTTIAGNVGIGTSGPSYKLDVSGSGRFTSSLIVSGDLTLNSNSTGIQIHSNGFYRFSDQIQIKSPSNGVLTLYNWGADDFGRLQLGGTTSSYPSIKRNGTGIDVRLADDSGYSGITAGDGLFTSASVNVGISAEYTGSSGRKYSLLSCYNCGSAGVGGFEIYDSTVSATRAYIQAGVNGWQTPSDMRLKNDIQDISVLDKIQNIRGTSYNLNDSGIKQIGVIAQEVKQVFPEIVSGSEEEGRYLGVNYDGIATMAIQGVKELDLKLTGIENFETESLFVSNLKSWLASVENGISQIYVSLIKTEKVETKQICLDDLCITRDELEQLLQNQNINIVEESDPENNSEGEDQGGLEGGNGEQNVDDSPDLDNGSEDDVNSDSNSEENTNTEDQNNTEEENTI